MDTHEDPPFKVNYDTLRGGTSTAYVDKQLTGNSYSGTNKHTDEPVVVLWLEGEQKWTEGFLTHDHMMQYLRDELMREYQKDQLETVIGPLTYGDRKNFEVYQDADLDWQIRPSKDYIGSQIRGILDTVDETEKEE